MEDYQNGQYTMKPYNEATVRAHAKELLVDTELLYLYMKLVARLWPVAAEANLTNTGRNRQAWLGQAAANMYCMAPEGSTKEAWRLLTEEQQDKANMVADRVIAEWEHDYKHMEGLYAKERIRNQRSRSSKTAD